jgi:hypothetical protein
VTGGKGQRKEKKREEKRGTQKLKTHQEKTIHTQKKQKNKDANKKKTQNTKHKTQKLAFKKRKTFISGVWVLHFMEDVTISRRGKKTTKKKRYLDFRDGIALVVRRVARDRVRIQSTDNLNIKYGNNNGNKGGGCSSVKSLCFTVCKMYVLSLFSSSFSYSALSYLLSSK